MGVRSGDPALLQIYENKFFGRLRQAGAALWIGHVNRDDITIQASQTPTGYFHADPG